MQPRAGVRTGVAYYALSRSVLRSLASKFLAPTGSLWIFIIHFNPCTRGKNLMLLRERVYMFVCEKAGKPLCDVGTMVLISKLPFII
jgi:hypothetical protein